MELYTEQVKLSILYEDFRKIFVPFMQYFQTGTGVLEGKTKGAPLNGKLCLALEGDVQVVVGQGGDAAAPGGAGEKAQLHEIGLVDVL